MTWIRSKGLPLMLMTLAVWSGTFARAAEHEAISEPMPFPQLPEAISSFGATVSGDSLYVFSGHIGRIPGNSIEGLSPHFVRINWRDPSAKLEELPMHVPSQSPGLVAWDGKIYRVGGLSFRNHTGEQTLYQSLDTFACYDPESNAWTDMPKLPVPRSSLDAAVVGHRLYVVGGWNLQETSPQDAPWHEEALVFDLTQPTGEWKAIAKPPFVTRALAAAAFDDKFYVLGGMNRDNTITKAVHIYDPATDRWSQGPELAGAESFAGFAISAFPAGDRLYFSGSEGVVYGLAKGQSDWQPVERLLFPRSFHRLIKADDSHLVAIAGVARGGGYLANLERLSVARTEPGFKLSRWSTRFPGTARQSQALLINGNSLYAFGGNNTTAPHDFSSETFVKEAFRFDLSNRSVERLPDLPYGVQAATAQIAGNRNDQSIYILGGLTHPGEKYQSSSSVAQYRIRSKNWMDEVLQLPSTRAMFHAIQSEGNLWMFGGSQVNTDKPGYVTDTWQWNVTEGQPVEVVPEAELPQGRRSFGATTLDGRYFVVGGLGAANQIVAPTAILDLKTRKWTEAAAPALPRVFPSVAAVGGKIYLAGGFAKIDGHFQPATTVEVYDPQANTWQTAFSDLPFDIGTMLEYQDRLLFYSIDSKEAGVAHFALLDPTPTATTFGVQPSRFDDGSANNDLAQRLMRLDRNNDSHLSRDEMVGRFQPLFDRIDSDKDGAVTREEITDYARAQERRNRESDSPMMMETPKERAEKLFADRDTNKDGKLSADEMPERLRNALSRIDSNQDGLIESPELEAFFAAPRRGDRSE